MFKKSIFRLYLIGNLLFIFMFSVSCGNDGNKTSVANNKISKSDVLSKKDSIKFANLTKEEPSRTIHYIIDTVKSKVLWAIYKHNGYVKFKNGYIGISQNKIVSGTFSVCMDSIVDSDIDYELMKGTLEKILKSADFFNVAEYPTSVFKIESTEIINDANYFISGYMKIFNKINPVKFKSSLEIKGDTLFAQTEKFTIDRTKWGLTVYTKDYIKNEEGFIVPNKINLTINIIAYKKTKDKIKNEVYIKNQFTKLQKKEKPND